MLASSPLLFVSPNPALGGTPGAIGITAGSAVLTAVGIRALATAFADAEQIGD